MNTYIENAKKLLQKEPVELSEFLDSVYEYCENRINRNEDKIKEYSDELNRALEGLSFEQEDAIGCACHALCAEYEYSAFTDGFQKGAALILGLLEKG